MSINWPGFFIGEEDWEFLAEIALRTLVMYIIILVGLRLLGKRGVKQLSIFELVVIISLGSAAGDPMFYKEVGLLVPVVIFAVIVGCYRLTTFLTAKSTKIDDLVEGKCTYLIKDGEFSIEDFSKEALAHDEFFSELRQYGISHLGQVETAILETSGAISAYYFPDEKVKWGLPILPDLFEQGCCEIKNSGHYACCFCGNVIKLTPKAKHICEKCDKDKWVPAVNGQRVK
ncbi:MAG: YetF domain-containing protein [Bacteroidota bacterium]